MQSPGLVGDAKTHTGHVRDDFSTVERSASSHLMGWSNLKDGACQIEAGPKRYISSVKGKARFSFPFWRLTNRVS
jgi:hypothetical protein